MLCGYLGSTRVSIAVYRVEVPNSNIVIIWTCISEWYVVIYGSNDGHQNDTCFKEIGLHAQNMLAILHSIVNIVGGTYITT
jgi:hypothetical protein